jgi:hypothetical protein
MDVVSVHAHVCVRFQTVLTSTRFIFGITPLTSLIAFAFCAGSILVKVTVNTVFSFGFSASAAAAGAAPPAAGAAAKGAATAMSAIFKRDYNLQSA